MIKYRTVWFFGNNGLLSNIQSTSDHLARLETFTQNPSVMNGYALSILFYIVP